MIFKNIKEHLFGQNKKEVNQKLQREIKSFKKLWRGGFETSKYGWEVTAKKCLEQKEGYSNMYKISEICIEPYSKNATIWDLGSNGGAWTSRMKNAAKVICSDVVSARHNNFYNNIPKELKNKIEYHKVSDFKCDFLADNSIDLLFSYDVFCHISYSGAKEYIKNMKQKLKIGANCFVMIADPDKYQDQNGRNKLMKEAGFDSWEEFINDFDGESNNGRWFFYGLERFSNLLESNNYKIINKDVSSEYDKRSPILHFVNL